MWFEASVGIPQELSRHSPKRLQQILYSYPTRKQSSQLLQSRSSRQSHLSGLQVLSIRLYLRWYAKHRIDRRTCSCQQKLETGIVLRARLHNYNLCAAVTWRRSAANVPNALN